MYIVQANFIAVTMCMDEQMFLHVMKMIALHAWNVSFSSTTISENVSIVCQSKT